MTYKDLGNDLRGILQEVSSNLSDRLVIDRLNRTGRVTLEESTFFKNVVNSVITEAADEFVPDEIDPDNADQGSQDSQEVMLYDEVGNAYVFSGGAVVPQDGSPEEIPEMLYDENGNGYTVNDGQLIPAVDGEQNQGQDPDLVNESTSSTGNLLEEGDSIVSKILANLK